MSDPTPAEIQALTEKIREGWSEAEYRRRSHLGGTSGAPSPVSVKDVSVSDELSMQLSGWLYLSPSEVAANYPPPSSQETEEGMSEEEKLEELNFVPTPVAFGAN